MLFFSSVRKAINFRLLFEFTGCIFDIRIGLKIVKLKFCEKKEKTIGKIGRRGKNCQ